MGTSLLMPSLSPTMEEGTISKWHAKEGQHVEQGTLLCSIETDKTTVDYESLDEGYLRKITVQEGGTARVNQLIGYLTEEADESFDEEFKKAQEESEKLAGEAPASEAKDEEPAKPEIPKTKGEEKTTAEAQGSQAPHAPSAHQADAQQEGPRRSPPTRELRRAPAGEDGGKGNGRIFASPLAKKIAQEKGIPLEAIQGSGPSGRILRADVENYQTPAGSSSGAVPTSSAAKATAPAPSQMSPVYGSLAPVPQTEDIALNKMRKTIGKRLLESYQGAPTFFLTMKMVVDRLNSLRQELNEHPGYRISVNDLMIKCVACALRQVPDVNATFHGDSIRKHSNIDISVAVALEGGLITPIIQDADLKTLGQISTEMRALAGKAKAGTLAPEEYQGGTFTISNLGMYGVNEFTAIINPPQAGILAIAGTEKELRLDDEGGLEQHEVMRCTMTSDHRVIDGALAARFMAALRDIVEKPTAIML